MKHDPGARRTTPRSALLAALLSTLLTLVISHHVAPARNPLARLELLLVDVRYWTRAWCEAQGWLDPAEVSPQLSLVVPDEALRRADSRPLQAQADEICEASVQMLDAGASVVAIAEELPCVGEGASPFLAALAGQQEGAARRRLGGVVAAQRVNPSIAQRVSVSSSAAALDAAVGEGAHGLLNLTCDVDGVLRAQELVPVPRGEPTLDLDWASYFAPLVAERATGLVLLDDGRGHIELTPPAVLASAEESSGKTSVAGVPASPVRVPVIAPQDKRMWLRFLDPARVPRLALSEVLRRARMRDSAWMRAQVAGRVLLVGDDSLAEQDIVVTPVYGDRGDLFTPGQRLGMPRLLAQALVLNTLLTRQWLKSLSVWESLGWMLLWGWLGALSAARWPRRAVPLAGLAMLCLMVAGALFVLGGWVVELAAPLATLLLAAAGVRHADRLGLASAPELASAELSLPDEPDVEPTEAAVAPASEAATSSAEDPLA